MELQEDEYRERIVIDCKTSTKVVFNQIKAKLLKYKIKNNEDALLWLIRHAGTSINFR